LLKHDNTIDEETFHSYIIVYLIRDFFFPQKHCFLFYLPEYKVVKVGQNLWANLAHHGFELGWVEFFYKFQYGSIFDPTH